MSGQKFFQQQLEDEMKIIKTKNRFNSHSLYFSSVLQLVFSIVRNLRLIWFVSLPLFSAVINLLMIVNKNMNTVTKECSF